MHDLGLVIAAVLVVVAALNALASRVGVPYPIVLVLGGLGLSLLPGLPDLELEPDLVLLVFLPPLLYNAAFQADFRSLRADARALSLISIGLVLGTAAGVAVVGHHVFGLSWPMAFALGAIVSPTDPVAATAIMRRLGAPRRVVNLVEGESLVNDASALVVYRVAVAAAVAGGFSLGDAVVDFVVASVGGVAVGLVVAVVSVPIRRRLDDPLTEITISLATGYAAFLPAEQLHVSGVLAAVTAGLWLGRRSHGLTSPATRIQATAVWETLTFLLNAALFVLIGLQLSIVLGALDGRSWAELVRNAPLVVAVVVGCRFAWLFTTPYLIRLLDRRPSQRSRRVGAAPRVVMAWSGLRGAVSLATALALPLADDAGESLPGRDLVLFVAFAVVLVTIVGQGLTLPWLVSRLHLGGDDEEEREELRARLEISHAALTELDAVAGEGWAAPDVIDEVRQQVMLRKRLTAAQAGKIADDGYGEGVAVRERVMLRKYQAERAALVGLRNDGTISNDVMHRIERELDLAESRLAPASSTAPPPSPNGNSYGSATLDQPGPPR